jgi:hypothetical protein
MQHEGALGRFLHTNCVGRISQVNRNKDIDMYYIRICRNAYMIGLFLCMAGNEFMIASDSSVVLSIIQH